MNKSMNKRTIILMKIAANLKLYLEYIICSVPILVWFSVTALKGLVCLLFLFPMTTVKSGRPAKLVSTKHEQGFLEFFERHFSTKQLCIEICKSYLFSKIKAVLLL
jgi:hypothetical protein